MSNFNIRQYQHAKTRKNYSQILTTLLLITTPTIALAEYKKPSQPSAPDPATTTTTTTRTGGCSNNSATELTAIAPYSYVGQTVSTHPTFAWFVPDTQPYPLEFQLYQQNASGKRQEIYKASLQSTPQFMKISLPKQRGLSVGQKYVWQVILMCNPNETSEALVTKAEIEVVAPSKAIEQQLAIVKPTQKAKIYAASGLWYDAWAEALNTKDLKKDFQLQLLEDLARSEANSGVESAKRQKTKIEQILQLERQQK